MKVTVKKEEVVLKEGDIIKSEYRGSFYMIALDNADNLVLINLSTFREFSEKYVSSTALLSSFFSKGYTIYPSNGNELVIGGSK